MCSIYLYEPPLLTVTLTPFCSLGSLRKGAFMYFENFANDFLVKLQVIIMGRFRFSVMIIDPGQILVTQQSWSYESGLEDHGCCHVVNVNKLPRKTR